MTLRTSPRPPIVDLREIERWDEIEIPTKTPISTVEPETVDFLPEVERKEPAVKIKTFQKIYTQKIVEPIYNRFEDLDAVLKRYLSGWIPRRKKSLLIIRDIRKYAGEWSNAVIARRLRKLIKDLDVQGKFRIYQTTKTQDIVVLWKK